MISKLIERLASSLLFQAVSPQMRHCGVYADTSCLSQAISLLSIHNRRVFSAKTPYNKLSKNRNRFAPPSPSPPKAARVNPGAASAITSAQPPVLKSPQRMKPVMQSIADETAAAPAKGGKRKQEQEPAAAAAAAAAPPAGNNGAEPRKKKQKNENTPMHRINMAAREGNAQEALRVFDEVRQPGAEGRPPHSVNMNIYSVLFHLCSGGDTWEQRVRARAASNGFDSASDGPEGRMMDIWEAAVEDAKQHTPPAALPEMAYTAMARAAVLRGDPEAAYTLALDMKSKGAEPRLRSFAPALVGFAVAGQWQRSLDVEEKMKGLGLELQEEEYTHILEACAVGAAEDSVAGSVLRRMSVDVVSLGAASQSVVERWFASEGAGSVFREGGRLEGKGDAWIVSRERISSEGASTGGQLAAVDLDSAEFVRFGEGIAKLAAEREKNSNDFKSFKEWMDRNGPHSVIIDGANVALFGQSTHGCNFQFGQLKRTVEACRHLYPGQKPLVVLHNRRLKAPEAQAPEAQALIEDLRRRKEIFSTPVGSNDDWYWLYACVRAAEKGILVSNDEMRDHIFQLLALNYFSKWKQRHQVRYSFTPTAGPFLFPPPPYTASIQELPSGAWAFPVTVEGGDGLDFLIVKPGQKEKAEAEGGGV